MSTDIQTSPPAPPASELATPLDRRRQVDRIVEEEENSRLAELRPRFAASLDIIRRNSTTADQQGALQQEGAQALVDTGFTRLRVPEPAGGTEISLSDLFALLTDLGAADPGVANAVRGHFTFIEILRHHRDIPEDARAHWLAEIAAGRLFGNAQTGAPDSPATTARKRPDGTWIVNGHKYYSSGSLYSDYIRVSAEDEEGRPVWAIVPTAQEGVTRRSDWAGFGQRTSASGSTLFEDAVVAPLGLLPLDTGVTHQSSFVQIYHLATLTGIVREVLDEAASITARKPPRKESFSDYALDVVGDLFVSFIASQSLVRTAADALENANRLFLTNDDRIPYELLSVYTLANQVAVIAQALEATTHFFDAAGASLTATARGLDRHWRNARTIASHNPIAVKPRLLGDYLVTGRFYGSPFRPFEADGGPKKESTPHLGE